MPLQVRAARNPSCAANEPAGYRPEYRVHTPGSDGPWLPAAPPQAGTDVHLYRYSLPVAIELAEAFLRAQAPHQVKPAKVPA